MQKFLVLYHSPVSAREQMANSTPEERKAGMDAWMAWAGRAGEGIVDLGAPLAGVNRVQQRSATVGNSDLAGYSILQADSADVAAELLADHPHLNVPDNSIEVLEFLAMPGT
jgi:hypothetical protein